MASGAYVATPLGRARASALEGKTVIVVGAGVSGLGAARSLANQGATVIVVEGRDRLGGRLYTDWSLGAPFEDGAGWVHGPSDDNPAKRLTDAVGAEYVVTDNDNLVVFGPDGYELDEDRQSEVDDTWYDLIERIDENLELSDTRSLIDAIRYFDSSAAADPGVLWAFSAYTEFSKGGPIENLSAVYFNRDGVFPGDDVVVTTGYDKLLGPLSEGLDIRLSTKVTGITYGGDGVTVTTDKGPVTGDFVICSVPLGVLKKNVIAFDPPLPASYQKSIDKVGFGSVTKLALKFEEPFWDTDVQYFGMMTEPKGRWNYWLNYRTFCDENILLGLSVGAHSPVVDQMTDEEMKADGLAVLRNVWEDDVGEPIAMRATHWYVDPLSYGAYAFPTPGSYPSDYDGLAQPVENRLVLCGEHTIFEYAGTIHGAYLSGLRAAEMVIEEAE
ncbi:NAD(P)-binding protein [Rhodospirillaceae bacterium KN72]|uniref:Tryptophan 2-monooxygenase n=2 Tax=Pacificispira spongiicola TaxID=2729598 RepID=A0A7Y0E0G1_9PROT|nr:NAD(P)-binding protein [Pacificispira spongiicola]